jgi:hypothetical protein
MFRHFQRSLIQLCLNASTIATALLSGTAAQAGQPWNCICNGQPKRFIASTYACEFDRYKGTGRVVRQGSKLLVPRCTAPQFRAWNRRACASEGCSMVPR